MWNTAGSRRGWSALALLLALSGCTALSDCKYEIGQKIRAKHAWEDFNSCQCESFSIDYALGWKAGYYDVATGGTGCAPVLPPKEYWKPPVFCEHDPSRRDDWYCGFALGAACATNQPDFHYLKPCLPPGGCPAQAPCCPGGFAAKNGYPPTSPNAASNSAFAARNVSATRSSLTQKLVKNTASY